MTLRTLVHEGEGARPLGPGVWLDRLQPGGRFGPGKAVLNPVQGGQTWTQMFHLGDPGAAFRMTVPDIRLPANQYWPLHWHDCWIAVVILDGSCLIGDWIMQPGDVLISAAGLEYGPLVIGPDGCQLFEVFAKLHLSAGGYAPEYRDHPTLQGGSHVFMDRSAINQRNAGRMSLPVDGVDGLIKGHLNPGARWDLGPPDDPERGVMAYAALAPGDRIAAHSYGDWHGLFIRRGSLALAGHGLSTDDVIIAEPGALLGEIIVGPDGAEIFEVARTALGMERIPC